MVDRIAGRIVGTSTEVDTSATALPAIAASGRRSIMVHNKGAVDVFLGPSTVTAANGMPLAANEKQSFELDEKVVLYGIVSSGTADVRTLEGV